MSTMPATFAYRSACEEYSPRQQSIFCPLITSALSVTKERFFSSRLRANRHIAGHKPSVLGRNLGDLDVDELPVTHCLWRWTKHLRRKLMVEDVKHEATAVLGPVQSSHSWCVETHEFPSARIHQLHPARSPRALLCLVHKMLQTCDRRQNGVRQSK